MSKVDMALSLGVDARDVLLPLHMRLSREGRIRHAGPTMQKVLGPMLSGDTAFADLFDMRRPAAPPCLADRVREGPCRLQLVLRAAPHTSFKGIAVADGRETLINLSFGISIVDAIRDFDLTSSDFAHTDLAIELLYLVEAKTAILEEWKSLNARLATAKMTAEKQAFTDTLTGLQNRRAMDHALIDLCSRKIPFGLINLDLDFFKQVNDTLGHAAGDHVLRMAAQKIVAGTRADDTLVRAGGDEFVLILPGLTDTGGLLDLARRLIAELERPIAFTDRMCRISGSAGIAIATGHQSLSPDTILERADRALYASKHRGRGRATVFSPDLPPTSEQQ